MNPQQGIDRPQSISTNATIMLSPIGFNPTWIDPSGYKFNSATYHQSVQGAQVPPSNEFSNNILRSLIVNPNSEFNPPAQPSTNPLTTSIATQHFPSGPITFPNQIPFANQIPSSTDGFTSESHRFSHFQQDANMLPSAPSGTSPLSAYQGLAYIPIESSNINKIVNEVRQSQVKNSRIQTFTNAAQMRQSNVMIQNLSRVVTLPVDDNQRQRKTRLRGCPRWLCLLLIILLALLFIALLILLFKRSGWKAGLQKTTSLDDTCPNGSNKFGRKCMICPPQTKWNGTECIKSTSTGDINGQMPVGVDAPITEEAINNDQCKNGFVMYLGRCLKCPPTSTWNGTYCLINIMSRSNASNDQPLSNKTVTVSILPQVKERLAILQPSVKNPVNKDIQTNKTVETQANPSCESGYIYYQNGCIPLIGHKLNAIHVHLRGYHI